MTSSKPYIVRAFYDWISDNQLTPYIVVDCHVHGVSVPQAFVTDGQIVLNISSAAVGSISMAGTCIEFSARFGGKLEQIFVPYGAVAAIYAKENGAGTSLAIEDDFADIEEVEEDTTTGLSAVPSKQVDGGSDENDAKPVPTKGKPSLKVIK